jgi:hypothetical protein
MRSYDDYFTIRKKLTQSLQTASIHSGSELIRIDLGHFLTAVHVLGSIEAAFIHRDIATEPSQSRNAMPQFVPQSRTSMGVGQESKTGWA